MTTYKRDRLVMALLSLATFTTTTACLVDHQANTTTGSNKGNIGEVNSGSAKQADSSDTPSDKDTKSNEAGEPDRCGANGNAVCVDSPPPGWDGPVHLQSAANASKLEPCNGSESETTPGETVKEPNGGQNIFVDAISKGEAACSGCKAKLETGGCTPAYLISRKFDSVDDVSPCGEEIPSAVNIVLDQNCTAIDSNRIPKGAAAGIRAPAPRLKEARCRIGEPPKEILQPPTFPRFFRQCDAPESAGTCSDSRSCISKPEGQSQMFEPYICILKEGKHECPNDTYSDRRTILYGKHEDTRDCGECQLAHTPGELTCDYKILHASNDRDISCEDAKPIKPADLCLDREVIQKADGTGSFFSLTATLGEAVYSGRCDTVDWGLRGDVRLRKPLTVCCKLAS